MTGRGGSPAWLAEIITGVRFLTRLPAVLRKPLAPADARAALRQRLERRETDFLDLARRAIYEQPASPYRRLLELAGCEYGDLVRVVSRDGLEAALLALYREGVYLTVEEFKGRRPAVRGAVSIEVDPAKCRNPLLTGYVSTQSSGSRGPRTVALKTLEYLRDQAVNKCLVLDGWGGPWQLAHWDVPGVGLTSLLTSSMSGTAPERWFSPVDPDDRRLHPRYRWSGRGARWGSRLAGRPLPLPRHVPVDDPSPIVSWMAGVLKTGNKPLLVGYASPIVRLCQAAHAAGVELQGARFVLDGEPVTRARLAVIRRTGAEGSPTYAATETGRMGDGCLSAREADEVHFFTDLHGLIQPGSRSTGSGLPASALLTSSLRLSTPFVLLNVSLGDQATLSSRACGCPLERLGWLTHLSTIRSYEKLTAAGMTFLDSDVIRVLEEVLPDRFGGAPTDYQLVEDEADDGSARLTLLVHPRVGPLPTEDVAREFLAAIATGSGPERIMVMIWRDAGLLRVERRPPVTSESGKILHLHSTLPTPTTSPTSR